MAFVIRWNWNGPDQPGPFVRDIRDNRHSYTADVKDAKCWKTRKNAERWLSLKDPSYAASCSIEEVSNG